MIADAKHNEHGSGTTSMRYEKISAAKPASPHIETDLSEEAMLKHHADSSMAAMRDLLAKLQGDMKHAADPREWAERYPWATVAAAAAAGFVAAATIVPHKHNAPPQPSDLNTAEERARMEAYVRDAARRAAAEATGTAAPPSPPQESFWTPLVELAKSAATKYIMSAAQTGIAAFAAAHAAQKMNEESDKESDRDSNDNHSSPNLASE